MAKKPTAKTESTIHVKTPPIIYLEATARGFYTRPHFCGFCGASGFAHQKTRPTATLFCDRACGSLYKRLLIVPHH